MYEKEFVYLSVYLVRYYCCHLFFWLIRQSSFYVNIVAENRDQ